MYLSIVVVLNIFFIQNVKGNTTLSYTKIVELSSKAIGHLDVKKSQQFLENYLFTNKKDQSLWFYAEREAYVWSNVNISGVDLKALQSNLEKVYRIYKKCYRANHSISKVTCYRKLVNMLPYGLHDLNWETLTDDNSIGGRAKWGLYYLAFASMSSHLGIVAAYHLKPIAENERQKILKEFVSIYERVLSSLEFYEERYKEWRISQITSVKMCSVKHHFWKEFVQVCEKRWRRSVDGEEYPYHIADTDAELDIADKLGTDVKLGNTRFRAEVVDTVGKHVVFKRYSDALNEKRGQTLADLHAEANIARDKYTEAFSREIDKFLNSTVGRVREHVSLIIKVITE